MCSFIHTLLLPFWNEVVVLFRFTDPNEARRYYANPYYVRFVRVQEVRNACRFCMNNIYVTLSFRDREMRLELGRPGNI